MSNDNTKKAIDDPKLMKQIEELPEDGKRLFKSMTLYFESVKGFLIEHAGVDIDSPKEKETNALVHVLSLEHAKLVEYFFEFDDRITAIEKKVGLK